MKMCPVGGRVFHTYVRTDGRTDRQAHTHEGKVAFRNFANTPKKCF